MDTIRISQRQFTYLLASMFIITSLINLPSVLVGLAGGDAIFSLIIPTVYALLIAAFYVWLAKLYPNKNLFEISNQIFGRVFGGALNLMILVHIWFIFMRDVRLFNFFIKVTLLPNTPTEIVLLLFFLVLMYYGESSIEIAARVNELIYPILLFSQLLLPLLLMNQFSIYRFEPFFVHSSAMLLADGALSSSWYGDIVVLGAFLHTIGNHKHLRSGARLAIMLGTFTILLFTQLSVQVFGTHLTSHQVYPAYSLTLQMYLNDFLDRLEQPFFWLYFPAVVIGTTITFIAMMIGIASFSQTRKYASFSTSFGILMLITCVLAFQGSVDVNLFANYGLPVYVLITQPLKILITVIGAKFDQRKKRNRQAEETPKQNESQNTGQSGENGQSVQSGQAQDTAGKKPAWTERKWARLTHILLALSAVSVVCGYLFGLDYQMIASWMAGLYALCITLTTITTYMETRRSLKETPTEPIKG